MISQAFSFLSSIRMHLIVGAVALGVGFAAGMSGGMALKQAEVLRAELALSDLRGQQEAAVKLAVNKARQEEHAAAELAIKAAVERAASEREIDVRYQTIIKKVPVYVSKEADDRCVLPVGFVRLHHAATAGPGAAGAGEVPDAAGQPNDAPSGVACSELLGVDVDNAKTYYSVADQLTKLQKFVKDQAALRGAVQP